MTTIDIDTRRDRVAGGLLGLLVGDALGVPYEFHPPGEIPPLVEIEFNPPAGFRRAHRGIAPGTWSDDGAQALCLLASLQQCSRLDLDDFSRRLLDWADRGYLAVDGKVFDIGRQTSRAFAALRWSVPPETSGPSEESDNGNGSLMRVLPLALWHQGSDSDLVDAAVRQSLPTHGHARSQLCCAMACLWARAELEGGGAAWERAADNLRRLAPSRGLPQAEIDRVLDPHNATCIRGSGYVVDTLWSARHALHTSNDYATAVRVAIALGNDTDTTAAVAGGIAGIRYGRGGIPDGWLAQLRGHDLLQPLLAALVPPAESTRQDGV